MRRGVPARIRDGKVFNGNLLRPQPVAVIIGDQVMRDAVEPGRKGQPHVFVSTDAFQRLEKNLRSEVFRVIGIADPKIDVVIDPLYVAFV